MSLLRNYMPTLPRHTLVWYHTSRWMGWCRNGHIVSSFALQLCANAKRERERVVLQELDRCRDSRGWSQTCPGRGVIGHWSRQEQVVQTVTVVPPCALLWYASGSTCLVRYPVSSNTTLQPQDHFHLSLLQSVASASYYPQCLVQIYWQALFSENKSDSSTIMGWRKKLFFKDFDHRKKLF